MSGLHRGRRKSSGVGRIGSMQDLCLLSGTPGTVLRFMRCVPVPKASADDILES